MAQATLSGSTITMVLESKDRGYVSIEFQDDSASTTGKRVHLSPNGGSAGAGIIAWTNSQTLNANERYLKPTIPVTGTPGTPECSKYTQSGSQQTITITAKRANTITQDVNQFSDFTSGISGSASLDSVHGAPSKSSQQIHIRQWTFTEGGNRIIITIVMHDDEFGGDTNQALLVIEGRVFTFPVEKIHELLN